MMRFLVLGILLVCSVPVHAIAVENNAIDNPGFEAGVLTPWYENRMFDFSDQWMVSTSNPRSGNYAATVDGNRELRQDFAPVDTGLITEISFWAVTQGGNPEDLAYVFFYDDGSENEIVLQNEVGSDNYQQFIVTSDIELGKSLVGFSVYGNGVTRLFVDDFKVNYVPEPGSIGLVLFGSIVLIRRRRIA